MEYRDNLFAWRVFLSLAHTGSITRTSVEMNRSASDITKQVASLEKAFGTELFDRSRRPFRLTRRGAELSRFVRPFVEGLESALTLFETNRKTRLIRVSAPIDLAATFIADQLLEYSDLYPGVRFELMQRMDIESVLDGTVDVGLLQNPAGRENLIVRPCISCTNCPLASPGYLRKNGVPRSVEDLARHKGLLLRHIGHTPTSVLYDENGLSSGILKWRDFFITNNQMTLKYLALKERGIAIDLSASNAIEELRTGRLVPVLPNWHRENWHLSVVTRQDRELASHEIRNFADWWSVRESADSSSRVKEGAREIERLLREGGAEASDPA